MNATEAPTVDSQVVSDGEALMVSLTTGTPLEASIARRIRERAQRITDKIYREQGLVDIAVPTLREIRK